jgi:predicted lysophospholipase L1 biosynthesis ABC-type transport system permease subunit
MQMLLRTKSPFLYEPIGKIDFINIQLFIAPLNIVIGLILGLLVMLNILAALHMTSLPKQCRIDHKVNGIWGILPSFLTGFACCSPSFLIPLSSLIGGTAVFATKVFRWFLPLSILILTYGLIKSLNKIKEMTQ